MRLVTVDGPSGAGKTRLAGRLARALDRAPIVHLDFFYPGWDGLAAGVELAADWVARPLAAGGPAGRRRDRLATRGVPGKRGARRAPRRGAPGGAGGGGGGPRAAHRPAPGAS